MRHKNKNKKVVAVAVWPFTVQSSFITAFAVFKDQHPSLKFLSATVCSTGQASENECQDEEELKDKAQLYLFSAHHSHLSTELEFSPSGLAGSYSNLFTA